MALSREAIDQIAFCVRCGKKKTWKIKSVEAKMARRKRRGNSLLTAVT